MFSKYSDGIELDKESWFSVTPEIIASHIAKRTKGKIILDAFSGAGGNLIQFAKFSPKVFGIDIDQTKIDLAANNASIYQVSDKIELIKSDFLML